MNTEGVTTFRAGEASRDDGVGVSSTSAARGGGN
jgi:hypothetical protein